MEPEAGTVARVVLTRTLALVAPTCGALVACSGDTAPADPVTVVDSAGIEIVLSPDVEVTYAVLDPDPLVSLGGPDADGPTQFYQVTGVMLDERGRIWVSDGQSGELRLFGPDGSHVATRGGRGEGPGEFTAIRMLGTFAGDSVLVADQANGRIAVYDADAELVRTGRLEAGEGAYPRPFDVYPDGSILGQVPVVYASDAIEAGALLPGEVRLMRFATESDPRAIVDGLPGARWLWTGRDMVPVPFTANAAFGLRADSVHLAVGAAFRVRVYEGDRVARIYGVDREARAVTSDDAAAYRDRVVGSYPEERHADLVSALDHPEVPSVLPAYTRLLVAADGTVWAGRHSPETLWEVFGVEGEHLGQVEMPAGFYPMSIRDGRVAGVWRDELGVEYVRVYRWRFP